MNCKKRVILDSIYHPKVRGNSEGIEKFLPIDRTLFFSYGRVALREGLRCCGFGKGDKALIPEFICKDLLSSFYELGIGVRFYKVEKTLEVNYDDIESYLKEGCSILLFVNYFGFPHPIDKLNLLAKKYNATLIEDNAHGFLSKDKDNILGLRGDIGIFSIRKTVSLPNGAAFVVNNDNIKRKCHINNISEFYGTAEVRYILKESIRPIMAIIGKTGRRILIDSFRVGRCMFSKEEAIAGYKICPKYDLSAFSKMLIGKIDIENEIKRRRELYLKIDEVINKIDGCSILYNILSDGVVPYGYPFYYYGDDIDLFQRDLWRKEGLHSILWPDLPKEINNNSSDYYNRLILIPFLW